MLHKSGYVADTAASKDATVFLCHNAQNREEIFVQITALVQSPVC